MFKATLFLIASFMLGATAFASEAPLLTKKTYPGYVPVEYSKYDQCDLYSDRVVITRHFGGDGAAAFKTVETRSIQTTGISQAIEAASREPVRSTPNGMCDAPSTTIEAFGTGQLPLVLFETGGCGSESLDRTGPFSSALKYLINQYCPYTAEVRE